MKTVIASLALSLLVSGTSLASTTTHPTDEKKTVIETAVYPVAGTMKLNVIVNNQSGRSVSVRLMNKEGETLATQLVNKSKKATMSRFDLSELEDGIYLVEISNGYSKEVKQVTLQTKTPVTQYRTIAMN